MISITVVRCVEHCNNTKSVHVWVGGWWVGCILNFCCLTITKLHSVWPADTLTGIRYMKIVAKSRPAQWKIGFLSQTLVWSVSALTAVSRISKKRVLATMSVHIIHIKKAIKPDLYAFCCYFNTWPRRRHCLACCPFLNVSMLMFANSC